MKFEFQPVTSDTWQDFESLMERRGSPHSCWCTAWIKVEKQKPKAEKHEKKQTIKNRIDQNIPFGVLAYHENNPVGWCAVAPRETYKKLGGDETVSNVWSIVCFYIIRPYRNMGLRKILLKQAENYAKESGANYIEGYPVSMDSPSYRFMGRTHVFDDEGFTFIKKAGIRRNVMIKKLK